MKDNFQSCGTAIIRSSLNSFEKVYNISNDYLIREFNDTQFKEVILIASPVLYDEVQKYIAGNSPEPTKKEKMFLSLAKYYQRFCTRSTPFGLFSGVSTVNFSNKTDIRYTGFGRTTRIDNFFISQLTKQIEQDRHFRYKLNYKLNSSLYELHDSYRYIEFTLFNLYKKYDVTSIAKDGYLEKVINAAGNYRTINHYASLLTDHEISLEDAEVYIDALIDSQILVSNLEPSVVTDNPFDEVYSHIAQIDAEHPFTCTIDNIRKITALIDGSNYSEELYELLWKEIDKLNIEYDKSRLIQVDCVLSTDKAVLDEDIINDIIEVMPILKKLHVRQKTSLDTFRKAYARRFDTTPQPLTKVLDPDFGIRYPMETAENKLHQKELAIFKILYKKLDNDAIELSSKDFDGLPENSGSMQPSFNALLSLVECDSKEMVYFDFAGGNSANDLFGRFTHLNDEIKALVSKIAGHELDFYKDFIIADILHLPESRTGNILFRRKIYDYHITYLGNTTVDQEFEISIRDIEIVLENDTFYLFSKKHKKFIIPRLNNAHNYSKSSLPIYKFLAEIQNQSAVKFLSFDYGKILNNCSILPRVTFKNVILYPKTWIVADKELEELKRSFYLKQFSTSLNLPEIFKLVSGDNHLFVDTKNLLSVQCFLAEIKSEKRIILREFYKPSKHIKAADGLPCVNEIHLPILNLGRVVKPRFLQISDPDVKHSFSFGNEWLYFKIYGGVKMTEKILLNDIIKFVNKNSELIAKWFFLRYQDEEFGYHIRVRFLPVNSTVVINLTDMFISAMQHYLDNEYLHHVSIDTYRRELSRYHTKDFSIEYSESFFSADSRCILDILRIANFDANARIIIAMLDIDFLLDVINPSIENKLKFAIQQRDSFAAEFGQKKFYNEHFNQVYRDNKNKITTIFTRYSTDEAYQHTYSALTKRNFVIEAIFAQLMTEEPEVRNSILSSYFHMSLNRLFLKDNRLNEYMVYDFLVKQYTTLSHTQVPQAQFTTFETTTK